MNKLVSLTDKNTLLLNIPSVAFEIPAWLQKKAHAAEYDNKSEYHVTIIGKKIAAKITTNYIRVSGHEATQTMANNIQEMA